MISRDERDQVRGAKVATLEDGFVFAYKHIANHASLFVNGLGVALFVGSQRSNIGHHTVLPDKSVKSRFCGCRIANNFVGRIEPEGNAEATARKRAEVNSGA